MGVSFSSRELGGGEAAAGSSHPPTRKLSDSGNSRGPVSPGEGFSLFVTQLDRKSKSLWQHGYGVTVT